MPEASPNARLEAFSDGVFAIAVTLLVIELRLPEGLEYNTSKDLWKGIGHMLPSIFAFILSFGVILITWVNHHNYLKLINKSCGSFIYSNGFLLLTVAFIPFPTSLMGEFLFTDHAAPVVILYNVVLSLQAVGWMLISRTAVNNHLGKSEKAMQEIEKNGKFGVFAAILYSSCSVMASWFPLYIAVFVTITWIFWLIFGIKIKHEEQGV